MVSPRGRGVRGSGARHVSPDREMTVEEELRRQVEELTRQLVEKPRYDHQHDRAYRRHDLCGLGLEIELPEFAGSLQHGAVVGWLDEVDRIFEYREVPDRVKVKLIAIKLKGRASAWWEQLKRSRERQGKSKIVDWEKMKSKLRAQFLPLNYTHTTSRSLRTESKGKRSFITTDGSFEEEDTILHRDTVVRHRALIADRRSRRSAYKADQVYRSLTNQSDTQFEQPPRMFHESHPVDRGKVVLSIDTETVEELNRGFMLDQEDTPTSTQVSDLDPTFDDYPIYDSDSCPEEEGYDDGCPVKWDNEGDVLGDIESLPIYDEKPEMVKERVEILEMPIGEERPIVVPVENIGIIDARRPEGTKGRSSMFRGRGSETYRGLTNNLCYTYASGTRSASMEPDVYYAHRVAFRARHYIEGRPSDIDSTLEGSKDKHGSEYVVNNIGTCLNIEADLEGLTDLFGEDKLPSDGSMVVSRWPEESKNRWSMFDDRWIEAYAGERKRADFLVYDGSRIRGVIYTMSDYSYRSNISGPHCGGPSRVTEPYTISDVHEFHWSNVFGNFVYSPTPDPTAESFFCAEVEDFLCGPGRNVVKHEHRLIINEWCKPIFDPGGCREQSITEVCLLIQCDDWISVCGEYLLTIRIEIPFDRGRIIVNSGFELLMLAPLKIVYRSLELRSVLFELLIQTSPFVRLEDSRYLSIIKLLLQGTQIVPFSLSTSMFFMPIDYRAVTPRCPIRANVMSYSEDLRSSSFRPGEGDDEATEAHLDILRTILGEEKIDQGKTDRDEQDRDVEGKSLRTSAEEKLSSSKVKALMITIWHRNNESHYPSSFAESIQSIEELMRRLVDLVFPYAKIGGRRRVEAAAESKDRLEESRQRKLCFSPSTKIVLEPRVAWSYGRMGPMGRRSMAQAILVVPAVHPPQRFNWCSSRSELFRSRHLHSYSLIDHEHGMNSWTSSFQPRETDAGAKRSTRAKISRAPLDGFQQAILVWDGCRRPCFEEQSSEEDRAKDQERDLPPRRKQEQGREARGGSGGRVPRAARSRKESLRNRPLEVGGRASKRQ